jgi:hypothetical protein
MCGRSGELRPTRVVPKKIQNSQYQAPGTKKGTKSQVKYQKVKEDRMRGRSLWQIGSYIEGQATRIRATLSLGCGEANSKHSMHVIQMWLCNRPFESIRVKKKSIVNRTPYLNMVEKTL